MAFSSVIRALGRSPLLSELGTKLKAHQSLQLSGLSRIAKGLVASALSSSLDPKGNLLVITATLEPWGNKIS